MSERELSGDSGRLQIIEAMARALFVMRYRMGVSCFDKAAYRHMSDACIREATNALTAAWPLIRLQLAGRIREREIRVGLGDAPLPADWWEIYRDAAKVIEEAE